MSAVWEAAPFSQTELLVLLSLADHAGDDGTCWPSVPRLAQRARTSERHVRRILTKLEADGWITREIRVNASSVYRLSPVDNTPDPQVTPDAQVRGGVTPRSGQGGHPGQVTPDPQVLLTTREPPSESSSSTTTARRRTKPVNNPGDVFTVQGLDDTQRAAFTRWLKDTGAHNPGGLIRTLARHGTLETRIAEWRAEPKSIWSRTEAG